MVHDVPLPKNVSETFLKQLRPALANETLTIDHAPNSIKGAKNFPFSQTFGRMKSLACETKGQAY